MTTLTAPTTRPTDLAPAHRHRKAWAFSGLAAAAAGLGALVLQGSLAAGYDPAISGDADAVAAALADVRAQAAGFHVLAALSAVLLLPFAAGLARRLRQGLDPDSLLPAVAAAGAVVTSVVLILGSGLDTEFGIFAPDADHVPAEHLSFYSHWTGTIPCLWTGIGVSAVCVALAAVRRAVPRWHAVPGFVLGGAALGFGVSPLEYIAVLPAVLWLLVAGLALALGDRRS